MINVDLKKREEERKEAQLLLDEKNRKLKEDLNKILTLPEGRRFIWDLISKRCQIHETVFNKDEHTMYFCEGQRSIGLNLLKRVLDLKPSYAMKMASEDASAKNSKKKK